MICECGGNVSFTEDRSLLCCDRCGYGARVPVTRAEVERLLGETAVTFEKYLSATDIEVMFGVPPS